MLNMWRTLSIQRESPLSWSKLPSLTVNPVVASRRHWLGNVADLIGSANVECRTLNVQLLSRVKVSRNMRKLRERRVSRLEWLYNCRGNTSANTGETSRDGMMGSRPFPRFLNNLLSGPKTRTGSCASSKLEPRQPIYFFSPTKTHCLDLSLNVLASGVYPTSITNTSCLWSQSAPDV